MLTPKEIAAADEITGLRLSADASWVVYSVGPVNRPGEHVTSALWLAHTNVEGSAKQITSGEFHDHSAQFHPDGSVVYFLSDRHNAGKSSHIYRLAIPSGEGDPKPITLPADVEGVISFSISPDGKYIAFISPDKPGNEGTKYVADVEIWGEKKALGRLRLIELDAYPTRVRTLVSVEAHVNSFTWSPDSSQIIYRQARLPDVESHSFPMAEEIVSILSESPVTTRVFVHPRAPDSPTIWTENGELFYITRVNPESHCSSNSLWKCAASENSSPNHVAYGQIDDLDGIRDLASNSMFAVEVATGLDTRIDVLNLMGETFTALQTHGDAIRYREWDIKCVDGDRYVFAALRSSGVTGEPENVWSGSTEIGKTVVLSKKLSSHYEWFAGKGSPISKPFYWTSSDGQSLQGVILHPPGQDLFNLPTVVVPHGGPYWRDSLGLILRYDSLGLLIASQGYLVLSPNYRGSRGRGDKFASFADGGMGTWDWADIETMIDEAVARKIADPERLAIAGESQGGFLAAWGCTRPNSRFKAGVISEAPTDWGTLTITTDWPEAEAQLSGNAPWSPSEPQYLRGSPIRYVKNVQIPLLMLHGMGDVRVPVTQSIGFMRGLVREGGLKEGHQLVMYPREDDTYEERAHAEDFCLRIVGYLASRLK